MSTSLFYDPVMFQEELPLDIPFQPARRIRIIEMLHALGWIGEVSRAGLTLGIPRRATAEDIALVHDPLYIQTVQELSRTLREGDVQQQEKLYTQYLRTRSSEVLRSVQKGKLSLASLKSITERGVRRIRHYLQGEAIKALPFGEGSWITASTWDAVTADIGAGLTAIDMVLSNQTENAFCLAGNGGHHAQYNTAMGFCIFNTTAIACRYALQQHRLQRIAILDLDVHHGNGTQQAFYGDPRVFFCDVHQSPWYPFTGTSDECGAGDGIGSTMNIPLPAGVGFEVYEPVLRQVVLPAIERFQPELLLISMGFDTHWSDPLGKMQLSSAGYAHILKLLMEAAQTLCQGKIIVQLLGGYNPEAVACGVATCLNVMLGDDAAVDTVGSPPDRETKLNIDPLIAELRRLHGLTGFRSVFQPKRDRTEILCEMHGEAKAGTVCP